MAAAAGYRSVRFLNDELKSSTVVAEPPSTPSTKAWFRVMRSKMCTADLVLELMKIVYFSPQAEMRSCRVCTRFCVIGQNSMDVFLQRKSGELIVFTSAAFLRAAADWGW